MTVESIFLSPGHNYFGHHGKPAGQNAVNSVDEAECVAGRGLRGDRFFDFKDDYRGQVTFFSREVFESLCQHFGIWDKSPSVLRRNVLVSGVDLNELIGVEFELQGIRFEGTQESAPCYWMDQAFASGTEEFLKGQGGLRAKILSHGILRTDARLAGMQAEGVSAAGR